MLWWASSGRGLTSREPAVIARQLREVSDVWGHFEIEIEQFFEGAHGWWRWPSLGVSSPDS
jgi:hypothetical protein